MGAGPQAHRLMENLLHFGPPNLCLCFFLNTLLGLKQATVFYLFHAAEIKQGTTVAMCTDPAAVKLAPD